MVYRPHRPQARGVEDIVGKHAVTISFKEKKKVICLKKGNAWGTTSTHQHAAFMVGWGPLTFFFLKKSGLVEAKATLTW